MTVRGVLCSTVTEDFSYDVGSGTHVEKYLKVDCNFSLKLLLMICKNFHHKDTEVHIKPGSS